MEQFRLVLYNFWSSRDAPSFSTLNMLHSCERTTHLDFSWFWVWYSFQAEQTMAWSSWQRSNTEIRQRKLKQWQWILWLGAQGAPSEHKVPSTQFQQFYSFYFMGNSSNKGHLQLHCFPQNQRPVRISTQYADAKYWYLGISLAVQDTFWCTRTLLKCKKINYRIIELFWLGKPSKIMESNHSSSTAKNITNPRPQVLDPQVFKSHQQWGPSSSHRATKQHPQSKPQPQNKSNPSKNLHTGCRTCSNLLWTSSNKKQPQTAGSSLSMIVGERRTDSRATTSKRGFWQFICGGFMASYLEKEL